MNPEMVGCIGLAILIILLFSRMWIGSAMALVGVVGFGYLAGFNASMGVLATVPYGTVASYSMAILPLFVFMGCITSHTDIADDLYNSSYKWLGSLPGGLAMGTIVACMGFAAICGSSLASAATMGRVAMPQMEKYNYSPRLAAGSVASGATLGILIPPSLGFILYSIITEQSVGLLFMAGILPGILPGILLSVLFILTIYIMAKRNPEMGPRGEKVSFKDKIASLRQTWPIASLFLLVMGGIYLGVFTPK